jgi:hypothetical protein
MKVMLEGTSCSAGSVDCCRSTNQAYPFTPSQSICPVARALTGFSKTLREATVHAWPSGLPPTATSRSATVSASSRQDATR